MPPYFEQTLSRHFVWYSFRSYAVQSLHTIIRGSLDIMSVGVGKEKRKKDTVAENTSSEKPETNQKELGDVK